MTSACSRNTCAGIRENSGAPWRKALRALPLLPERATLGEFLERTGAIFRECGWTERAESLQDYAAAWREILDLPISRRTWLRWLRETLDSWQPRTRGSGQPSIQPLALAALCPGRFAGVDASHRRRAQRRPMAATARGGGLPRRRGNRRAQPAGPHAQYPRLRPGRPGRRARGRATGARALPRAGGKARAWSSASFSIRWNPRPLRSPRRCSCTMKPRRSARSIPASSSPGCTTARGAARSRSKRWSRCKTRRRAGWSGCLAVENCRRRMLPPCSRPAWPSTPGGKRTGLSANTNSPCASAPARPLRLGATDWEKALRQPRANVPRRRSSACRPSGGEDETPWALAQGNWVHRWFERAHRRDRSAHARSPARAGGIAGPRARGGGALSRPRQRGAQRAAAARAGLVAIRLAAGRERRGATRGAASPPSRAARTPPRNGRSTTRRCRWTAERCTCVAASICCSAPATRSRTCGWSITRRATASALNLKTISARARACSSRSTRSPCAPPARGRSA